MKEPTKHLQVLQFDDLNKLNKSLEEIDEEDVVNIFPFVNSSSKTNYLVTIRRIRK